MEAKQLRDIKKGEYFTINPIEEPSEKQVYVKDTYDPGSKKFSVYKFSDVNAERFFKGSKIVYTGFYF